MTQNIPHLNDTKVRVPLGPRPHASVESLTPVEQWAVSLRLAALDISDVHQTYQKP